MNIFPQNTSALSFTPLRAHKCASAYAFVGAMLIPTIGVWAQDETSATSSTAPWTLFVRSFDLFTLVLIVCSFVAVSLMIRAAIDIASKKVLPQSSLKRVSEHLLSDTTRDLETFVRRDDSMPSRVLKAAIAQRDHGEGAMRDAADMAVGDEVSRLLRRIEPLQLIGNLGPLIGLAGTVWGMILAFTALGDTGGQAGPAALSVGISKALFHTLLGLVLAIPCLAFFGVYKARIDRICTRGMSISMRHLERLLDTLRTQAQTDTPADDAPSDSTEGSNAIGFVPHTADSLTDNPTDGNDQSQSEDAPDANAPAGRRADNGPKKSRKRGRGKAGRDG